MYSSVELQVLRLLILQGNKGKRLIKGQRMFFESSRLTPNLSHLPQSWVAAGLVSTKLQRRRPMPTVPRAGAAIISEFRPISLLSVPAINVPINFGQKESGSRPQS